MKTKMVKIFRKKSCLAAEWKISLIFILFTLPMLYAFATWGICDTDFFFIESTGKYILNNGFPTINPWSVDSNLGFVAQQWLYACLCSLCFQYFGTNGLMTFLSLQIAAFVFVFSLFFVPEKRWTGIASGLFCVILCWMSICNIRPQTVSIILLLLECLCLLRIRNIFWLSAAMTALVFLEMNLHAALWTFHFLVLTAFSTPFPAKNMDPAPVSPKAALACLIPMLCVLPLNPYGFENIAYFFKSVFSGMYEWVGIDEMSSPKMVSFISLAWIALFSSIYPMRKNRTMRAPVLYMAIGFSILSLMAQRNYIFLILPMAISLSTVTKEFSFNIKPSRQDSRIISCLLGTAFIFCAAGFFLVENPDSYFREQQKGMSEICDWLDANAQKDDKIFVGYNNGAFLQHRGYRKVYLDGRAELYTKSVNGKKDVLKEYSLYSGGINIKHSKSWRDIERWIEENGFDYFLVNVQVENFLAGYLAASPFYELIMETKNPYRGGETLFFFRKKQERQ